MPDPVTPDGRAREWLDEMGYENKPMAHGDQASPLLSDVLEMYHAHCSAEDAQRIRAEVFEEAVERIQQLRGRGYSRSWDEALQRAISALRAKAKESR